MQIRWSTNAETNLYEIFDTIAKDNPPAALNFAQAIKNKVTQLIKFPYSGRIVPEIRDPHIREIIWKNYRIIYTISDEWVEIHTIRHCRRSFSFD